MKTLDRPLTGEDKKGASMNAKEIVEKFIDTKEEQLETKEPMAFGSRIWDAIGVRIGDQIERDGDTLTALGGCGHQIMVQRMQDGVVSIVPQWNKWPGVIRYHDSRTGLGKAYCYLKTWSRWANP